ncbi:MAG: endonuclease/exonuclease/phosphatase family protein [Pseudobdellovibrionaceae bacterium]
MKIFTSFKSFLISSMMFLSANLSHANELKVMTYNIRCGSCEDYSNINHWNNRKFLVVDLIKKRAPDLIGLQEAEQFQIKDLATMLEDYDWFGVGRDDGKEQGEATTIFYRRNRFSLQSQKTLWLSETPEVVSRGWDGRLNRTVTILKLKDNFSQGREFYYYNTHLDHIGQQARYEGLRLIVRWMDANSEKLPLILTGDFNFTRDFPAYNIAASWLLDAQFASQTPPEGGNQTFNGFGSSTDPNNKIDYIFVNDSWKVLSHRISNELYEGRYPSDHFPVEARISLE